MKSRKKYFYLLLIALIISSCQIWRWYKLKRQLNDIPKYFSVKRVYNNDKKEDFIIMKKPVLKSSNVFYLTKKQPTIVKKLENFTTEVFRCIRQGDVKYSFSVNAYYNKDGYLYRIDPPNILTNAYDDYSYKRIGNEILKGKVNALDYEIKATYKKDNPNFNILDKEAIEKALGKPDEISTENRYIYSYKVDTVTKARKGVYLDVNLTFEFNPYGIIKNIHFNFATVNLYFRYIE